MEASKFFNGMTRLLTTKPGSSGTASKREGTLNKRGGLSSNYCCIGTPNMEDNTPQQLGVLLDVISCGFPYTVLLLHKSHCLNRALLVLEARVELHDEALSAHNALRADYDS